MKKLLATILALTLALSLSATAFAMDINQDADPKTGNTSVTYNVDPAYTVTIPETVTINDAAVTVSATGVKVDKGSQVVVKLTATSGTDNAFTVKTDKNAELTYKVMNGETAVNVGDTVLAVNPDTAIDNSGASGSASLTFSLADGETVQYAGTYTGTVEFTVSVDDAQ